MPNFNPLMVLTFEEVVLKSLFLLQCTELWALALLGCKRTDKERERERERVNIWGCGKISMSGPCLFCCQSVTLSAQHCTSLIHCSVCLVGNDAVHTCPSFPWAWPLLSTGLPVSVTVAISGLFQLFVQYGPSSGPSGAGTALLPLTAPPRVESINFRSRDFSLVPLDQG